MPVWRNSRRNSPQTLGERLKLHRELFDSFRRLDILQELVDDPRVTEIMVNGPDQVFVETGGKIGRWEKSFEIQGAVGRSDPADRQQCEPYRQHVDAAGGRQAFRRIPSSCGVGADSVKRSDLTIRKFPEPMTMERLLDMEVFPRKPRTS